MIQDTAAVNMIRDGIDSPDLWPVPGLDNPALIDKLQKDPYYFLTEFLGVTRIWDDQREYGDQMKIIQAVAKHQRVAVPSGHAEGKDWLGSRLMLWFLYSFMPSIVISTAASDRQISKVIWGELAEAFHGAKRTFQGRFISKQIIVDDKQKWYAMGFATKDVHNAPGKFQGFHQKYVFILFSESQAIERTIWEQAESLMTGAFVRWVAIGNPLINYGAFYEACQPGSGWEVVRLDCENSPNVREGKEVIPGMCSKEWVDGMADKYGKTHPTYLSKVKGLFPPKSVDAFIETGWVEWANTVGLDQIKTTGGKVAGVDVAASGNDKTVIAIRDGMKVIDLRKHEKQSTMVTVGQLVGLLQEGMLKVYVDATGVGTGVCDRLIELGYQDRVVPVNFGARAEDATETQAGLKNSDKYANMGTFMYANLASLLERKLIAFAYDENTSMQLLNRRMIDLSNGKKRLESKDDFKERGFDSPDEADALALCFSNAKGPNYMPKPMIQVDEDDTGISDIFK